MNKQKLKQNLERTKTYQQEQLEYSQGRINKIRCSVEDKLW